MPANKGASSTSWFCLPFRFVLLDFALSLIAEEFAVG
jgi:hypothetical protein